MIAKTIKDKSKNQILDAALKVFVKKGYAETRMEDIVLNSGLSKGAIYHHYSSKRDLFLSLIDYWESNSFPNFIDTDYSNLSASDTLRDVVSEIVKTFKNKKYVFLAELEFWSLANHDPDVRDKTKTIYNKLLNFFKGVVNKGIENKEFKDLNVEVAALSIMTSVQGVIWFSIFEKTNISAEEYLNDVIEFILYGFNK